MTKIHTLDKIHEHNSNVKKSENEFFNDIVSKWIASQDRLMSKEEIKNRTCISYIYKHNGSYTATLAIDDVEVAVYKYSSLEDKI